MPGALPFWQTAQLVEQGGTVLIEKLPVSVWPAQSQGPNRTGETHSHVGEAPLAHAPDLVDRPNRWLVVDGDRYRIVGAAAETFVPHVQLELLRVTAGG